jgi:hypothetical protein
MMICKNCNENGIGVIDSLANSVFGKIRCKKCFHQFSLNLVLAFLYMAIEASLTIGSAIYSIYVANAWPFILFILLVLVMRILIFPLLVTHVPQRKKFRPMSES